MRSIALLALVAGCGGRVLEAPGSGAGGVGGTESNDDTGTSSSTDVAPVPDSAATMPTDGSAKPPSDGCGGAMWSDARPDTFVSYEFVTQPACDTPDSCYIRPEINAKCEMRVQVRMELKSFTLSAADCDWVKRLATSAAMIEKLKASPYPCLAMGGTTELLTIATTERTYTGKYQSTCTDEPLPSQKKCVLQLVQKYWPDAKL